MLARLISGVWSSGAFQKVKAFFAANPSAATAMQTATGTKTLSGLLSYVRENKLTSIYIASDVLGGFTDFSIVDLLTDWLSDEPEAGKDALQIIKDLYHKPDPQLSSSQKTDVKVGILSDEFEMITRLRRETGWTLQDIALIQAVMRFPASTFEQYSTLLDTAQRLR
jgi:hypothetical protein